MNRARSFSCVRADAIFVGSVVGSPTSVVALGAAALADVGSVALLVLFVPGSVFGRVLVMPAT